MKQKSLKIIWGITGAIASLLILCSATQDTRYTSWKRCISGPGKCEIAFPQTPEHVRQTMPVPEEDYNMSYDVYVASHESNKGVFMVLIAQYPEFVNEDYAELSLESFLNGILTQHPNNQLVFADMIEVQGHTGMDFFIKTQGVYFKGRAVMAGSNLYLLANECEQSAYHDGDFNYFINSFNLKN
ncbi:MAG: hypothetical protein P0S94_03855 [Simkaniaceae bacterium]|nr:hypothetical protein [Simkaniaceae bacterium]